MTGRTIIACCTGTSSGAIALIRISGPDALEIAERISKLHSKKTIAQYASHSVAYGSVVAEGVAIDSVLFLIMRGPQTFTGENTIEITCHNNPFIISAIIQAALEQGAQLAGPGEFSQQAVLNNKIDVIQAEAINELIAANTQQGLKIALSQLQGALSSHVALLEQKLIVILAFVQASFEFIEEENINFDLQIRDQIRAIQQEIIPLKRSFDQRKQIRDGVKIALIGSVNAGKSSLFNTLIGKDRAIVTPIAGTTRDVIEAGVYQNDTYITFIDTAGLRKTNDLIEQMGIERSFEESAAADIVLLVIDGSKKTDEQERKIYCSLFEQYTNKVIVVQTKSDLVQTPSTWLYDTFVCVSAKNKSGIEALQQTINQKIKSFFSSTAPFLINQRQYSLLVSLDVQLQQISSMLEARDIAYELIAAQLTDAIANTSELTGKTISEQSMDAVFRQFCVGK